MSKTAWPRTLRLASRGLQPEVGRRIRFAASGTILQLVPGVIDNVCHEQANCCIPEDSVRLSANAEHDLGKKSELMTAPQRVSYRMESTLESVNKAEEMADQVATRAGFDEDTRSGISMAVREGMINAILHGNAYDTNKRANLSFEHNDRELVITISDEGHGFIPDEVPDPLAPENLLKTSGRGIFLMRAFMDEVRFRKLGPGTEITLIKRLKSG